MGRAGWGAVTAILVLLAAACVFGVLLWTTGWTWPLEGVAVLLPIATML